MAHRWSARFEAKRRGVDLDVGDSNKIEPNIHAGVKYFRFMMNNFYLDEPMDKLNKGLMTFAAYTPSPDACGSCARRPLALDPNVWFGNVERVTSERIGRETVQ